MIERPLPPHVQAAIERGRNRGLARLPGQPTGAAAPGAGHRGPGSTSPKPRRGVMNKTEARYAEDLELGRRNGAYLWWAFEPITLRLAKGARFTPDFAVLTSAGALEFHETKGGFIREAAMVRLKVAASHYPFVFRLVQFTRDGRVEKEIGE